MPPSMRQALPKAKSTGGGKTPPATGRSNNARGQSTDAVLQGKSGGAAGAPAAAPAGASGGGISSAAPAKMTAQNFKPKTSGQTAILQYTDTSNDVDLSLQDEHLSPQDIVADRLAGGDAAPKQSWQAVQWLNEVSGLAACIATALCTDDERGGLLADDDALEHVRDISTREELAHRLSGNGIAERLAEAIWPKLEILKAGPATAAELANKWKADGAGDLLYGGIETFFNGLEPRIGSPDPKVWDFMVAEHCSRPDSQVEFTTGNYSVITTSEVEWKFVAKPGAPIKWPVEQRLTAEGKQEHMRKLLKDEALTKRMEQQNKRLAAIEADLLSWNEVIGGRLYTGPLFVKYNGVLRGLDSPVPFLLNSMIQLCTAKEVAEQYMGTARTWERANGALKYELAKKEVNLYTTTIHVINSCIVKMGKLTRAKPVYRGMSGRILPDEFWKPNAHGVMGGVEFAFMSTTPDRSVAEQYSQDGFGIIVEIEQGMIDRGAEISWLSQYPHECEILFAPLAGLEAREMRIDAHPLNGQHIIIVKMQVSINLTNPTIEQVIAKRRKIVTDMGRGLIMEMRAALIKKGSNETEQYIRLMQGLMAERPLAHEPTWYNDDPCFQESVNETLRLKREVMNVPTLETRLLEGDAVAQLLGETLATKAKVLELPEITFRLFRLLRTLNLDGFGGIEKLPESIGGLKSLHTLHLRECESLLTIPASFGKLQALTTLNLTSCKALKELPSAMTRLTALTSLDCGFCKSLLSLPADIGNLSNLQLLRLQQCSELTELPPSIGKLDKLKSLILYGCSGLTSLPLELNGLDKLEELNLRSCSGLTKLPPSLGSGLPCLTALDLSMCKTLNEMPESLGMCNQLQTLMMGNCYNVPVLPPSITRLRNLHTLNLYNCGALLSLPDNFHQATSLRILSLQGCEKLKEVPPSLAQAPMLTTLTLWNCIALEIMPDLTSIPKLQLDGVPEQLADWEAEQKRKRAENIAAGRGGERAARPTAQATGWMSAKNAVIVQDPSKPAANGIADAANAAMAAMNAAGEDDG